MKKNTSSQKVPPNYLHLVKTTPRAWALHMAKQKWGEKKFPQTILP
jgi:hypothetical protein